MTAGFEPATQADLITGNEIINACALPSELRHGASAGIAVPALLERKIAI